MTPETFLEFVLRPGLEWTHAHGGPAPSREAAQFLLTVALTESECLHRCQVLANGQPGPARSWFQFEVGGVRGVLTHDASKAIAVQVCAAAGVVPQPLPVWRAIEGHDALSVAVARLLLLTDPAPIPEVMLPAWDCYSSRLWRPGRPDAARFRRAWAAAAAAVR